MASAAVLAAALVGTKQITDTQEVLDLYDEVAAAIFRNCHLKPGVKRSIKVAA